MTVIVNAEQHAAWNGDSGIRWVAEADRRDRTFAPVADALLAAAALAPGEQVLDIGCGCGGPTLAAADDVGPAGGAVGIDLSVPMLDLARTRAETQHVTNVTFLLGDAQTHPLPSDWFGAAISRFGTMFFADPVAAFANIARALAPGSRLCLATWQPLAANDWLTIPGGALDRFVPLQEPDPRAPGPYAQSDPAVVDDVLGRAGFTDVRLDPVTVRLTLGRDAGEAAEHVSDTRVFTIALAALPDDQRRAALDAIRASLAEHADEAGVVHLPAGIWIISARKG